MRFISCVVCSSSHELPSSALIIVPSAMRGRMNEKAAGREAKLYYMGYATMENRLGLAVAGMVQHGHQGHGHGGTRLRSNAQGQAEAKAGASLSARTKPMIPPITWPSCASPTSHRM